MTFISKVKTYVIVKEVPYINDY